MNGTRGNTRSCLLSQNNNKKWMIFLSSERKQSADVTVPPQFHKMLHDPQHNIVCLSLMEVISRKSSLWHELKKFSNDNQQLFFSNMALPLKPVDSYHLSSASSHLCPGWTTICWETKLQGHEATLVFLREERMEVIGQSLSVPGCSGQRHLIFTAGYGSLV